MTPLPLEFKHLGLLDYQAARELQESRVAERILGKCSDIVYFLEHPPVLTLGRRTTEEDHKELEGLPKSIPTHKVRRGGRVTYHGPGQLVIYPVISLRERRMGVKRFVELFLSAFSECAAEFGVQAECRTEAPGLWVSEGRKLAAVGLEIRRGVSNHGFSFNLQNDLGVYRHFSPCGFKGSMVTSLAAEGESCTLGHNRGVIGVAVVGSKLENKIRRSFG